MTKEETINAIKEESKKQATKKVELTKEEQELNRECFEAASMPIDFTDNDVVLGAGEIDIRKLSKENLTQMFFRLQCVQASQLRQLTQIVIDLERLVMLLLGTNGIPAKDIGAKINTLIEELLKESEKIKKA